MNKKIFLCGTLVAGIWLTNGCRSYYGYREFSTAENAGIENKKLISQKKKLFQNSGTINLTLVQDFKYTQKYKKTTYEEYMYAERSGAEFVADFIWSPVTLALQIGFSPFILLGTTSSDIEYKGHTYHYSFGRCYWNTFNPFLRYDYGYKNSNVTGTELFKKDEEIQKFPRTTSEIHTQAGTTVYAQYEGLKTPIAMKVPFTDAELAKQIFKYALPAQTKDVTITGDMGAKLELSIDSTSSLAANEHNTWKGMTSGSTKEIFDNRHAFLAQLKNWKENFTISPEAEAETTKEIIAKSREYITNYFKEICETDSCSDTQFYSLKNTLQTCVDEKLLSSETQQELTAKLMENVKKYIHEKIAKTDISNFSIADFKNLKAEIDKYCKDGFISEKEKTELALSLSPKIETKLRALKAAFITENMSALNAEIAEYGKLGFITEAESKKLPKTLLEVVKTEKERLMDLEYPFRAKFTPQKLYKGYKSGYSCARLNSQRIGADVSDAIEDSSIRETCFIGLPDQIFHKLLPWNNPRKANKYLDKETCARLNLKEIQTSTYLENGIEGYFACARKYKDAFLIAVEMTKELTLSDTLKKFQAEYPSLIVKNQKLPVDIPIDNNPFRVTGFQKAIILENDDIYIRLVALQVVDAQIEKKTAEQRKQDRKVELEREKQNEELMELAAAHPFGAFVASLKMIEDEKEKEEERKSRGSRTPFEYAEVQMKKYANTPRQLILICDKKLLKFFSDEFREEQRIKEEKAKKKEEEAKKEILDF